MTLPLAASKPRLDSHSTHTKAEHSPRHIHHGPQLRQQVLSSPAMSPVVPVWVKSSVVLGKLASELPAVPAQSAAWLVMIWRGSDGLSAGEHWLHRGLCFGGLLLKPE